MTPWAQFFIGERSKEAYHPRLLDLARWRYCHLSRRFRRNRLDRPLWSGRHPTSFWYKATPVFAVGMGVGSLPCILFCTPSLNVLGLAREAGRDARRIGNQFRPRNRQTVWGAADGATTNGGIAGSSATT